MIGGLGEGGVRMVSEAGHCTFAEAAEWYDFASPDHFWFEWRRRALLRLLADIGLPLDRELRGFDIGCGTGVQRCSLEADTAWTVDGADLNLGALNRVPVGRGQVLYYDVTEERAEFIESYDVVTLLDVLEHIEETRPFLTSILRHLRPGGHLVVNVPALQSLFSRYDTAAGHMRRYRKDTLARELDDLDVDLLAMEYWGFTMLPILVLRKLRFSMSPGTEKVLRQGFVPPGDLAHGVLRMLMRAETSLLARPPLGTSLLMVVRKNKP